jgi:multicomponent K+:H+ antiporter subunit D
MVLTVKADDVMRYTQRAANALHSPDVYVRTVMGLAPVPAPKEKKAQEASGPEAAARAAALEMQAELLPGIGDEREAGQNAVTQTTASVQKEESRP